MNFRLFSLLSFALMLSIQTEKQNQKKNILQSAF